MATKCIVLDFDGTFTDVEREASPFVAAFRDAVADLLGEDVGAAWARMSEDIQNNPGKHGWRHEGRIVAPASADPYIRSTSIAQLLFDARGVLRSAETRAAILQVFYHLAYERTLTAFRPEAKEVLSAIAASGLPAFVVTNARTEAALKKLKALGPQGLEKIEVQGDARKFVVGELEAADPRFSRIPEEVFLPGLERPVYPRRGRYFEALARIMQRTGVAPEEVLVCGDIYELDLSLPVQLGMQVQLVTGPNPPAAHEITHLEQLGTRAGHADSLRVILERIRS